MLEKNKEKYDRILDFINTYWEQNGASPTTRKIAEGTGIPRATAGRYLVELREKGLIQYDGRRDFKTKEQSSRWEEITEPVPIVGSIACGLPKLAEQNIEDYVHLPVKLFGHGKFYLLRARGDSMVNAGISSGDLVLIREQGVAEYGQIVVAQVGDEDATLKTYRPDLKNDRVVLHPENDSMDDIVIDLREMNLTIQGVAKDVIHRLP